MSLRALLEEDEAWCECNCDDAPASSTGADFARHVAASVVAGALVAFVEPMARAAGRACAIMLVTRVEALAESEAEEVELEIEEPAPKRKPRKRR